MEEISFVTGSLFDGTLRIVACDCCSYTVLEDYRKFKDARKFYRVLPDDVIVCGDCLADDPSLGA